MSSAHELDLKDARNNRRALYLNEFVVPYGKLVEACYEPVPANPRATCRRWMSTLTMRCSSAAALAAALTYAEGVEQLKHLKTLASVVAEFHKVMSAYSCPAVMRPWPDRSPL